jgi:hypothetical protein
MNPKCLIVFILLLGKVAFAQQSFVWPIKDLDTAREVSYLSDEEKDVILEMNMLRHNPPMYAKQHISWMKAFYNGKMLEIPGKIPLKTSEGAEAFDECIKALMKAESAPPLVPSTGMTKACRLLVYDQELTGTTGHKDSAGNHPIDRLMKFGNFSGYFAENIHYGDIEPRFIVISLLIDDGVRSRGHRKNLLNPEFNRTGIAIGKHKEYGGLCVINYASQYSEK